MIGGPGSCCHSDPLKANFYPTYTDGNTYIFLINGHNDIKIDLVISGKGQKEFFTVTYTLDQIKGMGATVNDNEAAIKWVGEKIKAGFVPERNNDSVKVTFGETIMNFAK